MSKYSLKQEKVEKDLMLHKSRIKQLEQKESRLIDQLKDTNVRHQ